MKHLCKDALWFLLMLIVALVIGYGLYSITMYKFEIYQKKYGEKMTFTDFMFDGAHR
jgi:hypothetical protein